MTIGIYGIFNKSTEECLYIGQSVTIEKRWISHRHSLTNNTHARRDFNEYWLVKLDGILDSLDFRILFTLEEKDQVLLSQKELEFFELYLPRFYGQKPSVSNNYMIHSDEMLSAMSETLKSNIAKARVGFRFENGQRIWERKCINCEKLFDGYSPTSAYCSAQCKDSYKSFYKECADCGENFTCKFEKTIWCQKCKYRQHNYERICVNCAKEFISGRMDSKYCSIGCKVGKASQRYSLVCKECGENFSHNKSNRHFCASCLKTYKSLNSCLNCKTKFNATSSAKKYCSPACEDSVKINCMKCSSLISKVGRKKLCDLCSTPKSSLNSLSCDELIQFKADCEEMFIGKSTVKELTAHWSISKTTLYKRLNKLYPERYQAK